MQKKKNNKKNNEPFPLRKLILKFTVYTINTKINGIYILHGT